MDIDSYINDNIDDIIDSYINNTDIDTNNINLESCDVGNVDILKQDELENKFINEDNEDDDIIFEEQQEMKKKEEDTINDEYYYFNLLNIFVKYYNSRFNKNDNFFSNINDINKDTSYQMELFFESIIEYKKLKETLNIDLDDNAMKYYFDINDKDKLNNFMNNYENQIYNLEINNIEIYSPSLLICLNYILENYNDIYHEIEWQIYNLRNL